MEAALKSCDGIIRHQAFLAQKYYLHSWDLDDLIQEGRLTCIRAWERFNPEQGTLFSTFAFPYIKRRYIDIYSVETRKRRGYSPERIEGLKEMEETNPIFPYKYRVGTIYRLDSLHVLDYLFEGKSSNELFMGWGEEHPVLAEDALQVPHPEELIDTNCLIEKIQSILEGQTKQVFTLIVFPTDEFLNLLEEKRNNKKKRKTEGENVRGFTSLRSTHALYAKYLGISVTAFKRHLTEIHKLYRKIVTI